MITRPTPEQVRREAAIRHHHSNVALRGFSELLSNSVSRPYSAPASSNGSFGRLQGKPKQIDNLQQLSRTDKSDKRKMWRSSHSDLSSSCGSRNELTHGAWTLHSDDPFSTSSMSICGGIYTPVNDVQ